MAVFVHATVSTGLADLDNSSLLLLLLFLTPGKVVQHMLVATTWRLFCFTSGFPTFKTLLAESFDANDIVAAAVPIVVAVLVVDEVEEKNEEDI